MYRVSGGMSGRVRGLRDEDGVRLPSSRERYALGPPSETGGHFIDPSGGALCELGESTILFNPKGLPTSAARVGWGNGESETGGVSLVGTRKALLALRFWRPNLGRVAEDEDGEIKSGKHAGR